MSRPDGRKPGELRPVTLERGANPYAEGSCLIRMGGTLVLCTASVEESVPSWRKGSGSGWLTAEYAMLPRATQERTSRERQGAGGRTQEIQRLIGRSLRAAVDLKKLGEHTIKVDCDVIQADGGTRTASITGGCVALVDAIEYMLDNRMITANPLEHMVASVSVGICQGQAVLDLDYEEDSTAGTDMNFVMNDKGGFIEVQGTGEDGDFSHDELLEMVRLGELGITRLISEQRAILAG